MVALSVSLTKYYLNPAKQLPNTLLYIDPILLRLLICLSIDIFAIFGFIIKSECVLDDELILELRT